MLVPRNATKTINTESSTESIISFTNSYNKESMLRSPCVEEVSFIASNNNNFSGLSLVTRPRTGKTGYSIIPTSQVIFKNTIQDSFNRFISVILFIILFNNSLVIVIGAPVGIPYFITILGYILLKSR